MAAIVRFEHAAFPVGLGFVAGAMDAFGFVALHGLLPAHVTGNLVLLAVELSRGQREVGMKIAAVPIFAFGVAISAWCIGILREREKDAFLPALSAQAALIAVCLAVSLLLPRPATPDDVPAVVVGCFALLAMALQNVIMRLVLNNLPPTTVMTGNITHVVGDTIAFVCHFPSLRNREDQERRLGRQAARMVLTLSGFAVGCLVAALGYRAIGASILILPMAALVLLLAFGQAVLVGSRRTVSRA